MGFDFSFNCPQCDAILHGKNEWIGKTACCNKCQQRFVVPPPSAAAQNPPGQTSNAASPPPTIPAKPAATADQPYRASPPQFQSRSQSTDDFSVNGGEYERTAPNTIQINVATSKPSNSLGIGSIVLAIVGLFTLCLPFVALPLLLLGLALGVAGIVVAVKRKGGGVGLPIAGSAICGILLIPPAFMLLAVGGCASMLNDAANNASKTPRGTSTNHKEPPAHLETPTEVSIAELLRAYERNRISAAAKYEKKRLQITGTIRGCTVFPAVGGLFIGLANPTDSREYIGLVFAFEDWKRLEHVVDVQATVIGKCEQLRDDVMLLNVEGIEPSIDNLVSTAESRREAKQEAAEREINRRIADGQVDISLDALSSLYENMDKVNKGTIADIRGQLAGMKEINEGAPEIEKGTLILTIKLKGEREGGYFYAIFDPKYKAQIEALATGQTIAVRGRIAGYLTGYNFDIDHCIFLEK